MNIKKISIIIEQDDEKITKLIYDAVKGPINLDVLNKKEYDIEYDRSGNAIAFRVFGSTLNIGLHQKLDCSELYEVKNENS